MENFFSFLHSGSIGDVWASIPAMRQSHKNHGKKILLYLVNGKREDYYVGASHPTRNPEGEMVLLNEKMIEMMIPLLKAQPFIEDVIIWNEGDEPHIDIDLDDIRRQPLGIPGFSITRWYFYIFPRLACDTTEKWLEVPDAEKDFCKGRVLINRTERYLVNDLDYSFLKKHEDQCAFIGTQREWNLFTMGFDLYVEKIEVDNFLEYAQAIKQSKFYVSNQSQGFQLAQGLLHPRMVEVCKHAPNVIVHGKDAYDYMSQVGLEYYFDKLLK